MEKKISVLCDLGVGGERGRVMSNRQCASAMTATDYKDPQKALRRWKRQSK